MRAQACTAGPPTCFRSFHAETAVVGGFTASSWPQTTLLIHVQRRPACCPPPAETVQDDGLPRSRAPRVQRSGLGDRLAAKGYSFEIMVSRHLALRCAAPGCALCWRLWLVLRRRRCAFAMRCVFAMAQPCSRYHCAILCRFLAQDEDEEEPQRLLGWSGHERERQYALPGRAEPLMLQSRVRLGGVQCAHNKRRRLQQRVHQWGSKRDCYCAQPTNPWRTALSLDTLLPCRSSRSRTA